MAENIKKPVARPNNKANANKSNMVRSVLFTFVLICFGAFIIASMTQSKTQKTEVIGLCLSTSDV